VTHSRPARGCSRGPGSHLSRAAGASLAELLAVLVVLSCAAAAAAPAAVHLKSVVSMRSAAGEVAVIFQRARSLAITRGVHVGLKFRKDGDRWEWTVYRDGNGNGVRTAEIARGIDRPMGIAYAWMRNDVRPAIIPDAPVPDPGQPGHNLQNPQDPIRFNSSDICSFSPAGESTPGSVYLWDGRDRMAVLRVYGRSAKLRALFYRRGDSRWSR
jgi:type II secretion system GspH-like protein